MLLLDPLSRVPTRSSALAGPGSALGGDAERGRAGRGGGARRRFGQSGAIHYLGGERLTLDREAQRACSVACRRSNWGELHRLADRVGTDEDDFAVLTGFHPRLAARPARAEGQGDPRRLAPLAEVWEKVRRSARDTLALNLDKKTFLFSTFADLSQATRAL